MTNLSKKGKQDIISMIIDKIDNEILLGMESSEIHHEIFNTDYFIIGYYQAEQWLIKEYGIFAAIERTQEYEKDNFGEIYTDCGSSEKVVNMLVYILGEEILNNLDVIQNNWDKKLNKVDLNRMKYELENNCVIW